MWNSAKYTFSHFRIPQSTPSPVHRPCTKRYLITGIQRGRTVHSKLRGWISQEAKKPEGETAKGRKSQTRELAYISHHIVADISTKVCSNTDRHRRRICPQRPPSLVVQKSLTSVRRRQIVNWSDSTLQQTTVLAASAWTLNHVTGTLKYSWDMPVD